MCSRAFRAPLARCRETTFSPRDWISAAMTPAWSAPPINGDVILGGVLVGGRTLALR